MKVLINGTLAVFLFAAVMQSCQSDSDIDTLEVSQEVIAQLEDMGFNPDGIEIVPEGYRIERDIIIRPEDLEPREATGKGKGFKQYSTNNLVSTGGSRNITLFMPQASGNGKGKKAGFNANYIAALDIALSRYNAENLEITFTRVGSISGADIVFTKLSKRDERRGVLGSAGFPTNAGDPFDRIQMSSVIDTRFGYSTEAIATVIAHEIGHCIGFRHTDYFDRSLSCGGAPSNEGPAEPIGANHIPGTTTGFSAESWMLACSGGGDRPFNQDDQTALDFLY